MIKITSLEILLHYEETHSQIKSLRSFRRDACSSKKHLALRRAACPNRRPLALEETHAMRLYDLLDNEQIFRNIKSAFSNAPVLLSCKDALHASQRGFKELFVR